ncbi:MAG: RTX toxin, partial [Deltaproteobacteria bacterium]|nr:RTX toxin [Deltaproteobacteria bacterium]MBW2533916.1 RTX toxin [Deltaproteobacteria bacterium]
GGGFGGSAAAGGAGGACDLSSPLDLRVLHSTDDAEEAVASGGMYLDSSDLELVEDLSGPTSQLVGVRFRNVAIPPGATIVSAHLELTADEVSTGAASLVVHGQAADDGATFASSGYDISSRPRTAASVAWNPPEWLTLGETHLSPDLSPIVQEIVDRSGWSPCNAIVLIVSGTGRRTADAYDGSAGTAPLLHVETSPP